MGALKKLSVAKFIFYKDMNLPEQQAGFAHPWVSNQQQLEEVITEKVKLFIEWKSFLGRERGGRRKVSWTPTSHQGQLIQCLTKRAFDLRYSLFGVHGGHSSSLDSETGTLLCKGKIWGEPTSKKELREAFFGRVKYAAVAATPHWAGVQPGEGPATRQAELSRGTRTEPPSHQLYNHTS